MTGCRVAIARPSARGWGISSLKPAEDRTVGKRRRIQPGGRDLIMRCRLLVLALAISIAPAIANAALTATIDIGKITCSQYLDMPPELSSKFSAWMSGWFSYRNRRTFVDFGLHQTNISNVKTWCQSNPRESVIAGLRKAVGSGAPAGARLDFNKITCANWLGYAPEDRDFVRYFLSGYYNSAANNNVLDYNRLQSNSRKVVAYCEKRKSSTLPTAIQMGAS
jgi:HdeA/HdeB family